MGEDGAAATRLQVTLLDTFQVCSGAAIVPIPGARLRALLVRLALAGGRVVGPGPLVDTLWPQDRPADPANALQSLVSRLRRLLGSADAVTQVEGGYRLDVLPADVDVLQFEQLAAAGRERLRAGDPHLAATTLSAAVGLWREHVGVEPAALVPVAPAAATRLARSSVEAEADLAEAELALGQAEAAAARLSARLAEHPVHERLAALLLDALAAQGRQAEALDSYERFRQTLADRLGADPGVALRERHVRLLRSDTAVDRVVAVNHDPAASADPPSNLPASLTSFIGRDDDLARIDTLLAGGRLVTVVGPGGAGKTRLALEAGRRHRHEYPDGTWLVDLASVTEETKIGAAVLAAIGWRSSALFEGSGRMRSDGDELDVLRDQLNGRDSLLVVDNCEQVIDAVAYLISALLPRCAGLRVLATSREPLAVDGEALVPLGPLALPEPDDDIELVRRAASVRLFTERAAAVRPGFDVDADTCAQIRQLVRGLDGMPLALELAAARLRTLSLTELVAGLSDRFRLLTTGSRTALPRHRTLRAVIAWSWDLLGPHERTVAERISVLPGGVTPSSATALVAGTTVPVAQVPELLAALVDRSLLRLEAEAGRYRMLETLREYGIDQLAEQGTLTAVRNLAAEHLAKLVAEHDPRLRGPEQLAALQVMRAEYDNALAALRHRCDRRDGDGAIRLAVTLAWYWQMFGRHADAIYWLTEALAVTTGEPTVERDCAQAVLLLSWIGDRATPDSDGAVEHKAELRAVSDRLLAYPQVPGWAGALTAITLFLLHDIEAALVVIGRLVDGPDVWLSGLAQMFRAQVAENDGDPEQARVNIGGALERFAQAGDRWGLATALPMRALLRQYDGDLDGALADLRAARAYAREFGSLSLNDEIFIDLRWIDLYLRRGDEQLAITMVDSARERALRSASPELVVLIDAFGASALVRIGELDRAAGLIESAETAMAGDVPFSGNHGRAMVNAVRASLCVKLGDGVGAEAALQRAYAAAVESRDMPILSMVAVTAAALAELHGRHLEVAVVLGAAARLRGTHDQSDRLIAEMLGRSRIALGEDVFADAYQNGWQLDAQTAVAQVDPARLRTELGPPEVTAG